MSSEERSRWGGPSPWAGKDSRTDAQKLGDAEFMAAMHRMRDSFCRAKDGLRAHIPEEAYDALVGEFFDGYAEAKRLYGIGRTDDAYWAEVQAAVGKGAPSLLLGTSTRALRRSLARLRGRS